MPRRPGGDRLRLDRAAGGAIQELHLDGLRLQCRWKHGCLKREDHEPPSEANFPHSASKKAPQTPVNACPSFLNRASAPGNEVEQNHDNGNYQQEVN